MVLPMFSAASVFNTSGVLWYADSQDSLSELLNGTEVYYPPYIALIEPVIFTRYVHGTSFLPSSRRASF